ncbi:hypothetical protein [Oceanobacillus halotolerans]|uniref:hypothetical protein n=1 Tax=Oceanobacillus halotolerans TaxID=2663380 RepID=UPI0013D9A93F|nr:hypothetical protein [Oceanobacillus halotolerans]
MKQPYTKWSVILSVICAITLFSSYILAPRQPEGVMAVLIQVLFFTAVITGLLSIIFNIISFIKKEKGPAKGIVPLIFGVILFIFVFSFIMMMLSFF